MGGQYGWGMALNSTIIVEYADTLWTIKNEVNRKSFEEVICPPLWQCARGVAGVGAALTEKPVPTESSV